MSYVRSSETENYTEIDWLLKHVTGYFDLYERFRRDTEFVVSGIGDCKIVDYDLSSNFEYSRNPVWMVFDLAGTLYKIEGEKDSYGGSSWSRTLNKVKKKEVVTFEYA